MMSAKIKGEEIATEFYNIPRNEFVVVTWDEAKKDNATHRAAIEHYDVIRKELDEYDKFIGR